MMGAKSAITAGAVTLFVAALLVGRSSRKAGLRSMSRPWVALESCAVNEVVR